MGELAVLTPCFAGDLTLFARLHPSVLEHTPTHTVHHVIVPKADRELFAPYSGPRCRVWTYPDLLPRRYAGLSRGVWLPPGGHWINALRPWPPIRGWVMQQALKLAGAAMLDADAVMMVDSDVVLVRPTSYETFTAEGHVLLYRGDHAVHKGMHRHIRWHHVARRLLGLDPPPGPPLHDYVSPLNVWEPAVVRTVQERIREVTGRNWLDAFTSQLHISEFILYGVFVDEIAGISAHQVSSLALCHNYWERTPLDLAGALRFVDQIPPEAVGMMISSKSGTPAEVRTAAVQRCAETTG